MLYVVRHGETNENKIHMMQGHMETYLNEDGINQAKQVGEKIKENNICIDIIVSSPAIRCIDTAKYLSNNEIEIITDKRLVSRNHGEFQGKERYEIPLHDYWNINKNIQYKQAESVKGLYDRVNNLLVELKNKYHNKNVLLVTHSGICRILYYYFNGIPKDGDLLGYESTNCSFEEYNLEEINENIIN